MRFTGIVFIAMLLTNCDCFRGYQGVVKDAETGEPIEGVEVYRTAAKTDLEAKTSTNGTYEGTIITGWVACRKPMYFLFSKEGYRDTLAVDSGELMMIKEIK